ncbi:hypothetical protein DFR86_05580 [Acidianus sulfidivorans JP7]|uniref:Uncharacterized protein n=1 Tax=Acidianus sulfidivorans JP7 TaxID=619593 RepID=A0A2U9IMD6_9CREN|nr:hypothetical protein [Acidianus sulfidivorans]AWR97084.1 hypothetical protein DFR86_05580 [Acidianus sulfidivorans JP7]
MVISVHFKIIFYAMHPVYEKIIDVNVPDNLQYRLTNIDNMIFLESNALVQPTITLYPELRIDGNRWVFSNNNKLFELIDNKLSIIEENSTIYDNLIYYINVEGNIEKIIKKDNNYIYNGEKYEKLFINDYYNRFILSNKKRTIIFWNKIKLEYESPKYLFSNNNGISLVYDDYTKIVTLSEEKTLNDKFVFLGYVKEKPLLQDMNGKIFLNNEPIGYCKENTGFIGSNSDIIVIRCGNSIKYLKDNIWKNIYINSTILDGFVNNNFIIIKTENETKVFDKNFTPLYNLKKCEAKADNIHLFLYLDRKFGIINTLNNDNILEVKKNYIDSKSPLDLYIRKYYSPIFKDLDVIKSSEKNDYLEFLVEPKILGSKEAKIILDSPFYSTEVNISIETKEPYIKAIGKIIRSNGNVLNTKRNSLIILKISGNICTFLPYDIKISYKKFYETFSFKQKQINSEIKIPVNIFDRNIKEDIVYLEVVKSNNVQLREEILLPIIDVTVDDTKWEKSVINSNKDVVLKILRQRNKEIEWEKLYSYPTYRKGIIIKPENSIITLNNKQYKVKKGLEVIDNYVIIGIDNIISELNIKIDFPYLILLPKAKCNYPIEIFYSTNVYRGFPTKVVFPIDPAYDKIKIRTYIGNETIEQTFNIPKDLYLKIAAQQGHEIANYLKSIGID